MRFVSYSALADLKATEKEGVSLTLIVLLALVLVTGESAKPDTTSTNELKVDQRKKVYVPGSERACVSEERPRRRPAYFEDWAQSRTSVKQRPRV